jgi:hypothetical protein
MAIWKRWKFLARDEEYVNDFDNFNIFDNQDAPSLIYFLVSIFF